MALGCSGQTGKGPVCHTLGAGACPCISLPAGLAALQRFPIAFGTFSVTLGCGGAFLLSRAAGIEQSCTLHRAWDTVALAQHQCSRDRVPGEGTVLCLLMAVWRGDKDPLVPWSSKPTPVSCPSAGGGVFVSREGLPVLQGAQSRAEAEPSVGTARSGQGRNRLLGGGTWLGCAGMFPVAFGFRSSWRTGWKEGQSKEGVSGGRVGAVSPAWPC